MRIKARKCTCLRPQHQLLPPGSYPLGFQSHFFGEFSDLGYELGVRILFSNKTSHCPV